MRVNKNKRIVFLITSFIIQFSIINALYFTLSGLEITSRYILAIFLYIFSNIIIIAISLFVNNIIKLSKDIILISVFIPFYGIFGYKKLYYKNYKNYYLYLYKNTFYLYEQKYLYLKNIDYFNILSLDDIKLKSIALIDKYNNTKDIKSIYDNYKKWNGALDKLSNRNKKINDII